MVLLTHFWATVPVKWLRGPGIASPSNSTCPSRDPFALYPATSSDKLRHTGGGAAAPLSPWVPLRGGGDKTPSISTASPAAAASPSGGGADEPLVATTESASRKPVALAVRKIPSRFQNPRGLWLSLQ